MEKTPIVDSVPLGPRAVNVHRALREGIGSGDIPPDARLPTEHDLCARFGVSRNTVRRALRRLELEGHIARTPRRGASVRAATETKHRIVSVMYSLNADGLSDLNRDVLRHHCALSLYCQAEASWDPELEARFLATVLKQRHLALLAFCSPYPSSNTEVLRRLTEEGVRVVHMQPFGESLPEQSFLMPDYRRAGYTAGARLIMAGYRRVLFAGLGHAGPYMRLQRQGVLEALRDLRGEEPTLRPLPAFPETANWFDVGEDAGRRQMDANRLGELALRSGVSVGVVNEGVGAADIVRRLLADGTGLAGPETLGLISIETTGDPPRGDLERLAFDPMAQYRRAIELVTAPDFAGIRELVQPRLIPGASVRAALGGSVEIRNRAL